ncbi:MAG TPA: hypothetical protein VN742_03365 [Candidatus Binataceae bacterium]|nr:hypothetical protein [Candidatus Binataceae bacterium]
MLGITRREGPASRQSYTRNLCIAEVDRSSRALALGGQNGRPFSGDLIEIQHASFEVFAENLGERLFNVLAAATWRQHGPDRLTVQLRQILGKTTPGKACGDARAEGSNRGTLILQGVAQDVARLLLHAAPVTSRAAQQPGFYLIFQMTNSELCHDFNFSRS